MRAIQPTIDQGDGPPLILVPGIQGRCEWLAPAVGRLARHFRVLSFSLDDVPTDRFFDEAVRHIDGLVDRVHVEPVILVGISYGGLVALRYAAHRPTRSSHLILCSTPSPRWRLDARSASYVRRPRLSLPLFAAQTARAMAPELAAALPAWPARVQFAASRGWSALRWPASPIRMSLWVQAWMSEDLASDCSAVSAPTLIVTGEPSLDRIVPVVSSLDFLDLIPGTSHRTIPATGHLGPIVRPDVFAAIVKEFVATPARPLTIPSPHAQLVH